MRSLKIIAPIFAITMGLGLVLSSVYAQSQTTGNNPAEQDTLDVPPGETTPGQQPSQGQQAQDGTPPQEGQQDQAGQQGQQSQPGQQGQAAPGAPTEDVDLPPPTPPPQPFVPSRPVPGTERVSGTGTQDAPFLAPQEGGGVPGQEQIPPSGQANNTDDELDWGQDEAPAEMSMDMTEDQLEDEFARRMMELNEEVLNREFYPVFIYEDRDRRDPFMPILQSRQSLDRRGGGPSGLLQYDLSQLTLTAIAWNTKEPKAMMRDPKANIYMVKKRDPIGRNNGYIEDIREGEVIVVESRSVKGGQKFYSTQIMRVGR